MDNRPNSGVLKKMKKERGKADRGREEELDVFLVLLVHRQIVRYVDKR